MAITKSYIMRLLKQEFPDAIIQLTNHTGDQDHYYLEIADRRFLGLSLIDQHKIVKQVLKKLLNTEALHSISIKTKIQN